ncbi:lipopolysaccharide biosynthesis protein [Candidatus Puniceispirillum marinum]|uniref:Polysaccharide export protein n=1 Tax=Puniceispirillum marinum (strain IMCC1322) TaxID=488538 RepID=D5BSH3_PUNMI|nr:oligosaccharide flippase family protein [Candidatus Puniceispirillum marinum]ADE39220.1 polysaccharide export protein [Candidatus Puniceispirillum marinum IMCC1322]
MTRSGHIFPKIFLQYLSLIVCGFISFALGLIIAKELGPAKFGIYLVLFTYGGYFAHFFDLGLKTFIYKNNNKTHDPLTGALVNFCYQFVVVMVLALFIFFFLPRHLFSFADYFMMLMAFASISSLQLFFSALKGTGALGSEAWLQFFYRLLSFCVILAVLQFSDRLVFIFFAMTISACLMIWYSYVKLGIKITSAEKVLLSSTVPFFTLELMISIYTKLEVLMLSFLSVDPVQIGQYGVATRIIDAQHTVIFPCAVIYFNILKGNLHFEFVRRLSLLSFLGLVGLLGVLGYFASLLVMPSLISSFFGDEYALSSALYEKLALVLIASTLNIFIFQKMIFMGETKTLLICMVLGCVISLAANLSLTVTYGLYGALYSRVIVEYGILALFIISIILTKPFTSKPS